MENGRNNFKDFLHVGEDEETEQIESEVTNFIN